VKHVDATHSDRRTFIKQSLATAAALSTPLGGHAAPLPGSEIVEFDAVKLSLAIQSKQVSCKEVMRLTWRRSIV
jgi:hypothetical protein